MLMAVGKGIEEQPLEEKILLLSSRQMLEQPSDCPFCLSMINMLHIRQLNCAADTMMRKKMRFW